MKNIAHTLIRRGLNRVFPGDIAPLALGADTMTAPAPVVFSGGLTTPLVLASPHSGRFYADSFVQSSRQSLALLRSGEDSFVEELAADAHALGPALLHATFPRSFCDVNRAAWDLDPRMFTGPIPAFVKATHRGLSGLGSIPRIVADNRSIYRTRLPFMEAALRIRDYWMPYHAALADTLTKTQAQHGLCLLLDLHSMPDTPEAPSPDFVLGDGHGTTCDGRFIQTAEDTLRALGFKTTRNDPYAGGYVTRHYGRPSQGLHVLQIEMRRGLYMDETTREKTENFPAIQKALAILAKALLDDLSTPPLRS
ncbi:MAG: N-formylglutamate amidohydrolase [Acetobacter indonesiensis]|jgi:N-formylglutamate amidohydrolase|nr:N-formylglutamate amidohydrolase [Acetobacter indonesiensis]MCI1546131.1 N-formylglutamate amidohydrolase [Acetobacter indonesiensis]MCI1765577.1 N-formylglutamate amidohydrolase [Acetobacter indonesiensis]